MDIKDLQPLSQARLRDMSWDEQKKAEAAILGCILQIAEKHCAAAGRELKTDKLNTTDWYAFGCGLSSALIPHTNLIGDPKYEMGDPLFLAYLRGMFTEIFDALMFAYDGDPAYTIHELTRAFGAGLRIGWILPLLLPARAEPIIEAAREIAAAEQEELRLRQDQMGY